MSKKVLFEKLHKDVKLPTYEHDRDSGMDVFARDETSIMPGETRLLHLGFKVSVPEGYEIQVRSKSGKALKNNLVVLNSPGTIDSSYRGECGVILHNANNETWKEIYIEKGQKIAQIVLCPVAKCEWEEVEKLDDTSRGDGGFGSTGE